MNRQRYRIVTARNYHVGIVHALLLDGSTRSVSSNIDRSVWRALGTRNRSEVVPEFQKQFQIWRDLIGWRGLSGGKAPKQTKSAEPNSQRPEIILSGNCV